MNVLPELSVIEQSSTVKDETTGKDVPVLSVEVIRGEFSDPMKLELTWSAKEMQIRHLKLQLFFETAIFISAQEDPELLRVTFND